MFDLLSFFVLCLLPLSIAYAFNIHVNKLTDANRIWLYSVLDAFNLMQLVSVPTHKDHNTLDLVIVPSDSTLVTDLTVLPVAPSFQYSHISHQ